MANITPTGFNLQSIKNSSVLNATVSTLKDTFKKLSDGLAEGTKVPPARDEALSEEDMSLSLLGLAEKFTSRLQGLNRATLNANDAVALVQVVETGLSNIQNELGQLRQWAVQGANSMLDDKDRQVLQDQAQGAQERIGHIIQNTLYDDISILTTSKTVVLQTGADTNEQTTIHLRNFSNAFTPVDLTNSASAGAALSFLKEDVEMVGTARTQLATLESRLLASLDALESASETLTGTGVRIQNADLAQEISNSVAASIRAYPDMAFQTQANQSAARVQKLL